MSKPNLKPVPKEDPEIRRVDLEGDLAGHWVEYRVALTGRQFVTLTGVDQAQPATVGAAIAVVGERVVKHSFGGDIMDQPMAILTAILKAWTRQAKDAALDPPTASGSPDS